MSAPGCQANVIPTGLESLFLETVSQKLYPHDLYPRAWFPDLDDIISAKFRETWDDKPDFRKGLLAADEGRAGEMIAAELGLPSIMTRHPRALVMIYRQLITGFIQRLHRRQEERQDIAQEIFARLLSGKLAKIRDRFDINYNPAPSFTSYFMVCIRNMYVDIVREGGNLLMKRDDISQKAFETDVSTRTQACQTAVLDEEFAKLRIILQLHGSIRDKIRLCLKLKCRFPVTAADTRRCFPSCSADDIGLLGSDFRSMNDRDMYRSVIPAFNRFEAKPVQADTLRKWVENKSNLIVSHLNRLHQSAVYDSENVIDLLGLFFKEEADRDQA